MRKSLFLIVSLSPIKSREKYEEILHELGVFKWMLFYCRYLSLTIIMAEKISSSSLHNNSIESTASKSGSDRSRWRMQNVVLVWVDGDIEAPNKNYQEALEQLQAVVDEVKLFIQPDDCFNFLETLCDEEAFLIVSGDFGHISCLKFIQWSN